MSDADYYGRRMDSALAEIEAGWNALGLRRNPQHDVFIADGINRLRAAHSEEMEALREFCTEADRLLRAAYADAHSEGVPVDVLAWLNPETST